MAKRIITKQKICDAAIKIITTDGLEGLSMRKIAKALNIEAASLYNHIKSKEELFDLIQEQSFQGFKPIKQARTWQNYLNKFAKEMREGLLANPKLVPLFATRPSLTTSALEQTDAVFGVLYDAGFKPDEVVYAFQSLCVFILGQVNAEVGHVPGAQDTEETSIRQLDLSQYENLQKVYSDIKTHDYDKWFEFGLKTIIDGLENRLKKRR